MIKGHKKQIKIQKINKKNQKLILKLKQSKNKGITNILKTKSFRKQK